MKRFPLVQLLSATAIFVTSVLPASAQDGYVGLNFGTYATSNDGDNFNGSFAGLDGAYSWGIGGAGKIVAEGSLRTDDIADDALDGDSMKTQSHLAVHYIHDLANGMNVGGFVGYGIAPHNDPDVEYELVYGGVEATYPMSPNLLLFGQIGAGDAPNSDTTDSFGFYQGVFLRAGLVATPWDRTAITLDFEAAASDKYEDENESGDFGSLYLGGQTALGDTNFVVTYGVRHAWFDALEDINKVDETTLSLGFRMVFGGGSPGSLERAGIIGSPYLPLRASNWTPALN